MNFLLLFVISLTSQWLFASLPTTPLTEKINEYCGNNPALAYIKEHKKAVLSPQSLEDFDVCSTVAGKDEKQKSELASGEIQSCLTKKFKYNPDYAKTISPYIAEAKQHTAADMKAYSLCVNNIKQCGSSNCDEPKKS